MRSTEQSWASQLWGAKIFGEMHVHAVPFLRCEVPPHHTKFSGNDMLSLAFRLPGYIYRYIHVIYDYNIIYFIIYKSLLGSTIPRLARCQPCSRGTLQPSHCVLIYERVLVPDVATLAACSGHGGDGRQLYKKYIHNYSCMHMHRMVENMPSVLAQQRQVRSW